MDRVIEMPVSQPTSCAFGGRDLDLLFITTASQRLSAEQLEAQPLAGRTFVLRVPVAGVPTARVDLARL